VSEPSNRHLSSGGQKTVSELSNSIGKQRQREREEEAAGAEVPG